MSGKIVLLTLAGVLLATSAFGSGYRIPEQSVNSVALSNAYVANTPSADAAYFNPANMAWLGDGTMLEGGLTYINLHEITYTDAAVALYSGDSKTEHFFIPTLFVVSPAYNNLRFGVSLTAPAGLTKRWDEAFPKTSAQEFSLTVVEANPAVSFKMNDKFSVALGGRVLYSEGVVKNAGSDLEGDTTEFGYNVALSFKPLESMALALTYRSKVDLNLEGDATIKHPLVLLALGGITGCGAEVSVPVPAVATLGGSYSFGDATIELVYDRTYWSAYENLDFDYNNAIVEASLGTSRAKDWKDTGAFRIGFTYQANDKLKLMAGFGIDDNPIPAAAVGFELPDSDARLYSVGGRYKYSEAMEIGVAYLYDYKDMRKVNNRTVANPTGVNGTFEDASAYLLNVSLAYKF